MKENVSLLLWLVPSSAHVCSPYAAFACGCTLCLCVFVHLSCFSKSFICWFLKCEINSLRPKAARKIRQKLQKAFQHMWTLMCIWIQSHTFVLSSHRLHECRRHIFPLKWFDGGTNHRCPSWLLLERTFEYKFQKRKSQRDLLGRNGACF